MEEIEEVSNNIFDYATKELSQDAFICWLFSWINHKKENEDLYNVAHKFLEYIFDNNPTTKKLKIRDFEIENIKRQEKNCDILIILKNGYYIIIEDKIYSGEHEAGTTGEKQLEAYKQKIYDDYINKDDKLTKDKIITVFYKIFDYDKDFVGGDVKLNREDILKIMYKDIDNNIYMDYKNRLIKMQSLIKNINNIPVIKWQKIPELVHYFYEHENTFKAKANKGERNSSIGNTRGSIYINWNYREIDAKKMFNTTMDFERVHLALNINYECINIFVKALEGIYIDDKGKIVGKGIKIYDKNERIEIQEKLKQIFEKELKIECCEKHELRKGSISFRLLTIDIAKLFNKEKDEVCISDLEDAIEKVTKIYNKIIEMKEIG